MKDLFKDFQSGTLITFNAGGDDVHGVLFHDPKDPNTHFVFTDNKFLNKDFSTVLMFTYEVPPFAKSIYKTDVVNSVKTSTFVGDFIADICLFTTPDKLPALLKAFQAARVDGVNNWTEGDIKDDSISSMIGEIYITKSHVCEFIPMFTSYMCKTCGVNQ